jgi:trimeric autotransporter adhesin
MVVFHLPTPQVISFTSPESINSTSYSSSLSVELEVMLQKFSVTSNAPYAYTFESLGTGVISNQTANSFDVTVTETSDFRITGTDAVNRVYGYGYCYCIGLSLYRQQILHLLYREYVLVPQLQLTPVCQLKDLQVILFHLRLLTAPVDAVTLVTGGAATPATNLGFGLDDAGWSANIPVGFGFNFFGTIYNTSFYWNKRYGILWVIRGNVGDFTFVTLPSTTEPFNMIAALAMDNTI